MGNIALLLPDYLPKLLDLGIKRDYWEEGERAQGNEQIALLTDPILPELQLTPEQVFQKAGLPTKQQPQ